MTGGRLSDRFVCRVAGLPARLGAEMRADRSAALATGICRLEERIAEKKEVLSGLLHAQIGAETEPARRLRLVALRRVLYNLRFPTEPGVLDLLDPGPREAAGDLLALSTEQAGLLDTLSEVLAEETENARRCVRRALEGDDFQRALALSSRALHQAQQRYLQAPPGALRARERQIERGLLRYLTRMALKATPFATFCAVLPGRLEPPARGEESGAALRFLGDPLAKQGLVRLNKAFCGILFSHLAEIPDIRRRFLVRLNPTIHQEGDEALVFLTAVKGREVFQRLRTNPALEILQELLGSELRELGELIREIGRRPEIDEPDEVIEAYTARLIEIGFLHLTTGIPAQDLEWDRALEALLAPVEHERARRSVVLLQSLRELVTAFRVAEVAARAGVLDRMDEAYEAWRLGEEIRVRARVPLFEDATSDARAVLPRTEAVAALEGSLSSWVELTSPISLLRRDQMNMRCFFESFYGGRPAVPLLRFYEDFHREHYKAHLEREEKQRRGESGEEGYDLANPFRDRRVARLLEARHALALRIARGWAEAGSEGEVALAPEELKEIVAGVEPLPAASCLSVTFFADLAPGGSGTGSMFLVIRGGTYVPGYGKMFSRFLDLFPAEWTADLVRDNQNMTPDTLAELCDDAHFNANLHPPLLAEEIAYPMTESRGGTSRILPSDLAVVRDPLDPAVLSLRHTPTGRTILPVDTGFLNPRSRPPLYRLLSSFMPAPSFTLPLPEMAASLPGGAPATVITRPRIVFDRRILLARRTWLVPAPCYPRSVAGEREDALFLRLARWRRSYGIPEQVYLAFQPIGPTPEPGKAAVDPEARKPQYIDFASPLLAALFAQAAPEHDGFLAVLEERLPDIGDLACAGGEPVVSELVLQWNRPAAQAEGRSK